VESSKFLSAYRREIARGGVAVALQSLENLTLLITSAIGGHR
jgi:hypothetical protein